MQSSLKKLRQNWLFFFFSIQKVHKFICFSTLTWMHFDLQFGVFYHEHDINWPISFFKKMYHTYTIRQTWGSLFWECVWRCQIWLWLRLTCGVNRCLRARASFRAQLHCVRSRPVAPEVAHLCGCLNGIIWGAQKCPHSPPKSCL